MELEITMNGIFGVTRAVAVGEGQEVFKPVGPKRMKKL